MKSQKNIKIKKYEKSIFYLIDQGGALRKCVESTNGTRQKALKGRSDEQCREKIEEDLRMSKKKCTFVRVSQTQHLDSCCDM